MRRAKLRGLHRKQHPADGASSGRLPLAIWARWATHALGSPGSRQSWGGNPPRSMATPPWGSCLTQARASASLEVALHSGPSSRGRVKAVMRNMVWVGARLQPTPASVSTTSSTCVWSTGWRSQDSGSSSCGNDVCEFRPEGGRKLKIGGPVPFSPPPHTRQQAAPPGQAFGPRP